MRRHIVCLGDSNTHGYCADPSDCADHSLQRFNEEERWTCLLQRALGPAYLVLEEGLSGRTTIYPDPDYPGLTAQEYLFPCLKSHEPVSLLILMLGTNDTRAVFGADAPEIARGMEQLISTAQSVDCWGPGGQANILVIAPPAMDKAVERASAAEWMGPGCAAKSRQLPALLAAAAARKGCYFLDAEGCPFNRLDYMHLTRAGHALLAQRLAQAVPGMVGCGP